MEEKESLQTLNYTINIEEYEKAFITFQKRYVFPKNIIMTVILVIIMLLYAQQVYKDLTYTMSWILMAVCAAFAALIWYNAYKIRKNLIKSIKVIEDDSFTTDFYDDSFSIKTQVAVIDETNENVEIQPKIISYSFDNPEIMEIENMFIIYLRKQMFYVIPKRCLDETQISFLQNEFSEKLDKKFIKMKIKQ